MPAVYYLPGRCGRLTVYCHIVAFYSWVFDSSVRCYASFNCEGRDAELCFNEGVCGVYSFNWRHFTFYRERYYTDDFISLLLLRWKLFPLK